MSMIEFELRKVRKESAATSPMRRCGVPTKRSAEMKKRFKRASRRLGFFASYGLGAPFNRENLFHGFLDLDYLIVALLVGGLASREKQTLERSMLLRPDGLVLK
jgi:hypothetical protein